MMEILPKLKIRGKVAGNNQQPHVLYFLHHKGQLLMQSRGKKEKIIWGFVYQAFKWPIDLQNERSKFQS